MEIAVMEKIAVMERAQRNLGMSNRNLRARPGGPTPCVGGSEPGAESH